jgi:hypothetical protein
MSTQFWSEYVKVSDHFEDLGVNEDIIKVGLKRTGFGLDACSSELRPVARSCEHDNEPSCSITGGVFRD